MSKSSMTQVRINDAALAAIKAAAAAEGVSLSQFIRDAALARATQPCPRCHGLGYLPE